VQLLDPLYKIPSAPRNAVECRHQHDRKLFPPRISHEGIEPRTACLLSANTTIFVFVHNLEASLCRQLSEIVQLRLDVLVGCTDSDVDGGGFFHSSLCSFSSR